MTDRDPTHLTVEQRRAMLAGVDEQAHEDATAIIVPRDYVTAIAGMIMEELRSRHITKSVEVAVSTKEPKVAITMARLVGGGWKQETDCLQAWIAGLDPREVAREAAGQFDKNLSMWVN